MDKRITELLELAQAEGLTLPFKPEMIIRLEDAGHVVDLTTGAVILGEGDRSYKTSLSDQGWRVALQALANDINSREDWWPEGGVL